MPRLRRMIDRNDIEVIHARRVYAREVFRHDPSLAARNSTAFDWKTHVFRKEVTKFLDANEEMEPDPEDFMVLCVGDSEAETEAARKLRDEIGEDCVRILKLAEEPDVSTMCRQVVQSCVADGAVCE